MPPEPPRSPSASSGWRSPAARRGAAARQNRTSERRGSSMRTRSTGSAVASRDGISTTSWPQRAVRRSSMERVRSMIQTGCLAKAARVLHPWRSRSRHSARTSTSLLATISGKLERSAARRSARTTARLSSSRTASRSRSTEARGPTGVYRCALCARSGPRTTCPRSSVPGIQSRPRRVKC